MAEFTSRLCSVCDDALRLAISSIQNRTPAISDEIAHHPTKDSLVDSVLRQSCHLCRLIIYHIKLHWVVDYSQGPEEEEPTSLTEDDFKTSDFDYATFPSDRIVIRSYMLGLPENIELKLQISEFGDGSDGVLGTMKLDCEAFAADYLKANLPRFWIFAAQAFGGFANTTRFNDNTAALSSQKMLKQWLNDCNNDHGTCTSERQSFQPTRLLDLNDVDTKQRLRLVNSQDCDPTARYVTLSHCWGALPPFQLTSKTEDRMREGFGLEELPKTFRDAIKVASWAQVRYIWIDSCCIIQGSKSDWEKEAKMMEKVYQNTYFNISADHSKNSQGGCFTDRLAYKITPCPYTVSGAGQVFLLSQFDFMGPLKESPISERAWVIQERFLSPRIVHFTADQLFWECAGMCACETFPKGLPWVYDNTSSWQYRATTMNVPQANQREKPDLYKVWKSMCEDYSRTRLTYLSDKLIAFSGMARDFQSRLPSDTYLAGMWKTDLEFSLLWTVTALDGRPIQPNGSREKNADPYITASLTEKYRAPSWSWLSKDCGVLWSQRLPSSSSSLIEILEASVDLIKNDEPTGDIQGGSITVRGILRAASWTREGNIDSIILDGKHGNQLHEQPAGSQSPRSGTFLLQRDTGDEFPVKELFCLLVRQGTSTQPNSLNNQVIQGLVLGLTGNDGQYQRLGHFEANGLVCCNALQYELQPAAQKLDYPWGKANLPPLMAQSDDVLLGAGDTSSAPALKDQNAKPLDSSMAIDHIDQNLFKKVEERIITII